MARTLAIYNSENWICEVFNDEGIRFGNESGEYVLFIKCNVPYDYARLSNDSEVVKAIKDLSEEKFPSYGGFSGDPERVDEEIGKIAEKSKKVSKR